MLSKLKLTIALLIVNILLSSCTSTRLDARALSPDALRLAAANNHIIRLANRMDDPSSSVGHQYILLVLPFGVIYDPHFIESLNHAGLTALGLRGYRAIISGSGDPAQLEESPTLDIKVSEYQLSAYDYFFFRKLYIRIRARVCLIKTGRQSVNCSEIDFENSKIKLYAFKKDLEYFSGISLEKFFEKVFKDLRI